MGTGDKIEEPTEAESREERRRRDEEDDAWRQWEEEYGEE